VISQSDQQLLRAYAERRSEEAFAELVRRHVDFVFSVALRMVRDPQLAEDVTQGVFVALAGNARPLVEHAVLAGWLHRTARNIAAQAVRSDVRRRAREQEAVAMNDMLSTEQAPVWEHIAPQLDTALGDLNEMDRDALLLRYFQGKSAREIGQALGVSDEAAQKRVSRAVEHLRECFAKRGLTVGATGLVAVISANAVQTAPIGLSAAITTTALAGTTIAASTAVTLTKALAMTTLQKAILTTAIVAAVGTGIYQAHQASSLRAEVHSFQQQQGQLSQQIQALERERDEATNRLELLASENSKLKPDSTELLRLRAEVARLRARQTTAQMISEPPSAKTGTTANVEPLQDDVGRELGEAIIRGEPNALARLSELVKSEGASFRKNGVGLTNNELDQLQLRTFAPQRAALRVISEEADKANPKAIAAINEMAGIPELQGLAIQSLGKLAANGNNDALEILLNPSQSGFSGSSFSGIVGALVPTASNGNEKAIDALALVAKDTRQQPLWLLAANGLSKPAEAGNTVATDALISLAESSTNQNVQRAVLDGLRRAASNQNQKAADALRSLGRQ
jgi:RNA polymerase sigma factor (sigma-70 family)